MTTSTPPTRRPVVPAEATQELRAADVVGVLGSFDSGGVSTAGVALPRKSQNSQSSIAPVGLDLAGGAGADTGEDDDVLDTPAATALPARRRRLGKIVFGAVAACAAILIAAGIARIGHASSEPSASAATPVAAANGASGWLHGHAGDGRHLRTRRGSCRHRRRGPRSGERRHGAPLPPHAGRARLARRQEGLGDLGHRLLRHPPGEGRPRPQALDRRTLRRRDRRRQVDQPSALPDERGDPGAGLRRRAAGGTARRCARHRTGGARRRSPAGETPAREGRRGGSSSQAARARSAPVTFDDEHRARRSPRSCRQEREGTPIGGAPNQTRPGARVQCRERHLGPQGAGERPPYRRRQALPFRLLHRHAIASPAAQRSGRGGGAVVTGAAGAAARPPPAICGAGVPTVTVVRKASPRMESVPRSRRIVFAAQGNVFAVDHNRFPHLGSTT